MSIMKAAIVHWYVEKAGNPIRFSFWGQFFEMPPERFFSLIDAKQRLKAYPRTSWRLATIVNMDGIQGLRQKTLFIG